MSKRKIVFLSVSIFLVLTLLTAGVFGQATQRDSLYRFLSIFTEVFSLARNNYVEQVESEKLVEGAFSGVTEAIDEFSYYVAPMQMRDYERYRQERDAPDAVGLVVTKRFGYAFVIAPLPGSPADEAGIEAGDFIERIGETPTQKMAFWEIEKALRGPEGSKLRLGVLRSGMSKRDDITLTRRSFTAPALKIDTYGSVAYLKIPSFRAGTAQNLRQLLSQLQEQKREKLILDIRENASGSVEEAIAAADELLSRGIITSLSGRRSEPKQWDADNARAYGGEILVLTDASTAGPGEIFAAAINGNARGKLVGIATYGMAIHQRFVSLPSGGGLHLTIAHYTTPERKPIKEQGVRPDVSVDLAAVALQSQDDKPPKEDLILERALRLFGESALKVAA
jgi:carboxyl-terminal processing protease